MAAATIATVEQRAAATKAAGNLCPGCDGQGVRLTDHVLKCQRCGGYFSLEPAAEDEVQTFVDLKAPMQANAAAGCQVYFDFMLGPRYRVHGWFDRTTKRVVQWG